MKNYQNFLFENFHLLVVKFSVCLNRRVSVMKCYNSLLVYCTLTLSKSILLFFNMSKNFWMSGKQYPHQTARPTASY